MTETAASFLIAGCGFVVSLVVLVAYRKVRRERDYANGIARTFGERLNDCLAYERNMMENEFVEREDALIRAHEESLAQNERYEAFVKEQHAYEVAGLRAKIESLTANNKKPTKKESRRGK